jgi:hypothetical protein
MGGLGKSTIASRLICDRLPEHQALIWSQWGQNKQKRETLNADKLLEKLSEHLYDQKDLEQYLEGKKLQKDLTNLFKKLSERGRLLVLIFDDFEWNLEPQGGGYRILEEPARILKALVNAITTSQTRHKIVITCRYDNFDGGEILNWFYSQGLDGLSGADLQKKLRQLENFNPQKMPPEIIERAIALAKGNPRLLEDLNEKVLSKNPDEAEKLLTEYQNKPELWKDRVIWTDLYAQIDEPLSKALSYGLIYQIPVPRKVLQVICEDKDGQQIQRGINLGLVEESSDREESKRFYIVSPILSRILNSIKLPQDEREFLKLSRIAYQYINKLWGNKQNNDEKKWREIFRLAFVDIENPERFREQFTNMIAVQYNSTADRAYEYELRKLREYFLGNQIQIYQKLGEYLEKQDWKKADIETAIIIYQFMVIENYHDFYDLFRKISLEVIKEIDRIWKRYSDGKFGIKEQKIYQGLAEDNFKYNKKIREHLFSERFGWQSSQNIPILLYLRRVGGGFGYGGESGVLFSRVDT